MSKRKMMGGLMAAALALNCVAVMPFTANAAEQKIECETGTLTGTGGVKTEEKGFSGDGYVYLESNSDVLDIPVTVDKAGMYDLKVCYQAAYGEKIQNISVNGVDAGQMSFTEKDWTLADFGAVKLNEGKNTISIVGSWGWTNFDYITLEEATLGEIKATQTNTCDADAIPEAKKVMAYLASVYGEHILSGQQEIYMYGPHDVETEFNYIEEKTGKLPAIRGFDYGNFCCPAFGSDDGSTERVIAWAAKGGLATASFHLNVPTDFASYEIGSKIDWSKTTYSEKTDFSPSKAATDGTKENQYYTQALDTLAEQFLILQEKGIPVIWRPLHEAEGGGGESKSWFWWGREGSKAYRQLYIYTYKYLTETKGCHNLIWEWNSYAYSTSENWYPGDAYVDIIGYDKYNCTDWSSGSPVLKHNDSAISSTFYTIMEKYNSAKMVAMAECDSFSTVENLTTEKAGWLYFMPWYDGGSDDINFLSNPVFNTEKDLIDMYTSDYCITLDELPKFSDIEIDPTETNEIVNTEPTEPQEGHASITADDKGNFKIDLPEAGDTVCIEVSLPKGATYANGGLGVSIPVDGVYYWANVQWEAKKSGTIELTLADNLLNVTYNDADNKPVEVEDKAVLAAVKEALGKQKSFEGQVWYVDKGTSADVAITDAYVKSSGEETTEPTEESTEESTEDTSKEIAPPDGLKVGDADANGEVDILDVITINKAIMGKEVLSDEGLANIDFNQNQKPDADESMTILKLIVGMITEEQVYS